jgi:glutathione reductase (NADPH)
MENAVFDVVVIGAGNAGRAAAGLCAARGKRVCIVEGRDVGGTCPLRGCVPKKVLVAAAETMDLIARAGDQGVRVQGATLDWSALMAKKESVIAGTAAAAEKDLQGKGIDVVHGRARFVARDAIEVDGRRIGGTAFVVATGSKPRALSFPGGHERMITSDEFLDMKTLPRSVAFVGAGVIAFEFAHVLVRAGAKVTLIEAASHALPMFDEDAAKVVVEATRALGVDLITAAKVDAIEGRTIRYEQEGRSHSLDADVVVHGAGRVADLDDLGLDVAGLARAKNGGIEVDEHLRSKSRPDVFVAGDAVVGTPQLSPVASYQGKVVGHNLTSEKLRTPDYRCIPQMLFTVPPLASVGMTEKHAKDAGLRVEVKVNDMRSWRSSRTYAERVAWSKVVLEAKTDRILGAQIVGHGGQETIHAIALAMAARPDDARAFLADFVWGYPTFHADLGYMI